MASKEVLQEALMAFPGTTFVVSHDRHFLNPVVNKILEIQPGSFRAFPGNLDDYLWKIDQERAGRDSPGAANRNPAAAENPRERRRRLARHNEQLAPLRKSLQELERDIAALEKDIAAREAAMADKAFFERGQATADEVRQYEGWKSALAARMEQWESTGARLEAIGEDPPA